MDRPNQMQRSETLLVLWFLDWNTCPCRPSLSLPHCTSLNFIELRCWGYNSIDKPVVFISILIPSFTPVRSKCICMLRVSSFFSFWHEIPEDLQAEQFRLKPMVLIQQLAAVYKVSLSCWPTIGGTLTATSHPDCATTNHSRNTNIQKQMQAHHIATISALVFLRTVLSSNCSFTVCKYPVGTTHIHKSNAHKYTNTDSPIPPSYSFA